MNNSGELTPRKLAEALRGGFDYLQLNRGLLDRLNVFPVPDGDTGSNMASTLASGIDTIGSVPSSTFKALADRFITEINRCSRGNSGFILARFFHGFFEIAVREEALSVPRLAECVSNGAFHVNGALFAPTEGTMISILSAVTDALTKTDEDDVASALGLMDDAGTRALFRTPEQLPVLARAGVIDSGALGLLCISGGWPAHWPGRIPWRNRRAIIDLNRIRMPVPARRKHRPTDTAPKPW
jgi:dihydroxyacetone kinase-like predicted kinase